METENGKMEFERAGEKYVIRKKSGVGIDTHLVVENKNNESVAVIDSIKNNIVNLSCSNIFVSNKKIVRLYLDTSLVQQIMILLNEILEEKKQEEIKAKESASKIKIVGFEYIKYPELITEYDFKYDQTYQAQSSKVKRIVYDNNSELLKMLKLLPLNVLATELKAEKIQETNSHYGGFLFNEEQTKKLIELAKQKQIEQENKKNVKETELKKLQDEKIAEAKRTGKPVFIRNLGGYDGDINGEEGSGWISISEIAYPDGSIKEEHCSNY